MDLSEEVQKTRRADYPIHPLILNRWSPRAMTGEPLSDEELKPLFEAARWAPSSSNAQPWRFLYVKRETSYWNRLFDLLVDFNKEWCKNAAVLGLVFSRMTLEKNNKPSRTHVYDTGAAWENFCLEGTRRGLVVHGMEGFDYDKARTQLKIPDDYQVEAMAAIGKPGQKDDLPPALQAREFPNDRKPQAEFVFEGSFKA